MKRLIHSAVFAVLLTAVTTVSFGLAGGVDEYLLKAVFLERFTRFIDYGSREPNTDRFFVITVFGENPFGNRLEQVYQNQNILNRKVKLIYTDQIDQIGDPDILYIGKDKKQELEKLLLRIQGTQAITVTDAPSFSGSGVMINLRIIDDKIRFEIDLESAGSENIRFDRVLLMNAIIVKHEGTQ